MYRIISLFRKTRPTVQTRVIIHPIINTGLLPYTLAIFSPIAQKSTPKKKIEPNKDNLRLGEQYIFISETQFVRVRSLSSSINTPSLNTPSSVQNFSFLWTLASIQSRDPVPSGFGHIILGNKVRKLRL